MIPVLEKTSVDGIPVLRCDAAGERCAAGLVFRVGRFDETLPVAGITHLVEHLTLSDQHRTGYHFNAQVSGLFTAFIMDSADPGDIAAFLAAVCRGLAADRGAALDREKRVLRTEAASRGSGGAVAACLNERYGAAGPGLAHYEEYGLHRLDWDEVEAWRSRWFTAGNAVLWVSGPLPGNLRLDLPRGDPSPPAAARARNVRLPGYMFAGRGSIGMSMTAARSYAVSCALKILESRLTQELRHERGVTYAVKQDGEWIDANQTHSWIQADALPEHLPIAGHAMLSTFEALAENGCTQAEIADYARNVREMYGSPGGPLMALHRRAQDHLCWRPASEPDEVLEAVGRLEGAAIQAAAAELHQHLIVAVPTLIPAVQGRMARLPIWSADQVEGRTAVGLSDDLALTTGNDGITLTVDAEKREYVTVRYPDAAALLCWKNGVRGLIGLDGFSIVLDPQQWPDGQALVASIQGRVPDPLHLPIDRPGPASWRKPRPAKKPEPAAAPARGSRRFKLWYRIGRIISSICLLTGAGALISGNQAVAATFLVTGVAFFAACELLLRRRRDQARQRAG